MISRIMLSPEFWTSEECHIATNPHRPEDADGLASWAAGQGMKGLCLFQTSGSEGTPKWVALTKEAFLVSGRAVNEHLAVTKNDIWLVALPLHHVGGFSILARAHLSGSRIVHDEARWNPRGFVELCGRARITLVSLVPAQVHDLVRERLGCPAHLRAAIIGGGGMSPDLSAAARALGWPVLQSYGMTEAASQIATQPLSESLDHESLEILPPWHTRVDDESRLVISGPALARGYIMRGAGGDWEWRPLGEMLTTRDRVRLWDHDGRRWLRFVGRESGYVKILGELVHLAPLQARLETLALTHDVARIPVLMPMPDARRESRLVLVAEDEKAASLQKSYNALAEPLYQISEVVQIPQIPRSSLGKVDLAALKNLLSAPCSR